MKSKQFSRKLMLNKTVLYIRYKMTKQIISKITRKLCWLLSTVFVRVNLCVYTTELIQWKPIQFTGNKNNSSTKSGFFIISRVQSKQIIAIIIITE